MDTDSSDSDLLDDSVPIQLTHLDTLRETSEITQFLEQTQNLKFGDFFDDFQASIESAQSVKFIPPEDFLNLADRVESKEKLQILKIGLESHSCSLKLWLEYLQTASGVTEWLSDEETINSDILEAIESTKLYFKDSKEIFDLGRIIYETLGKAEKVEELTVMQLKTPHESHEETMALITDSQNFPDKMPKSSVFEKFKKLEMDALKLARDVPEEGSAWEWSMGWLNYANNLNKTLKQTGTASEATVFPFHRAIATCQPTALQHLSDQFWTVYLNHIEFKKSLTPDEKRTQKLHVASIATKCTPWYGQFWLQSFNLALALRDETRAKSIFDAALNSQIQESRHVVELLRAYAEHFPGSFSTVYEKLQKMEEFYPDDILPKQTHASLGLDHFGSILQLELKMCSKSDSGEAQEKYVNKFAEIVNSSVGKSAKFWITQDVGHLDTAIANVQVGYDDSDLHYVHSLLHLARYHGVDCHRLENDVTRYMKKNSQKSLQSKYPNKNPPKPKPSQPTNKKYNAKRQDTPPQKTFNKSENTVIPAPAQAPKTTTQKPTQIPVPNKTTSLPEIKNEPPKKRRAEKRSGDEISGDAEQIVPNGDAKKSKLDSVEPEKNSKKSENSEGAEPKTEPEFKVFLSNINNKMEFPKNAIEKWMASINVKPVDVDIAFNGTKFRGFAIATLTTKEDYEKCIANDRKELYDHRALYVSPYQKREGGGKQKNQSRKPGEAEPRVFKFSKQQEETKVYVSGLKTESSRNEQNLRTLFPALKSIRIPTNKSGTEYRPYAYVEFSTPEQASAACQAHHETEFYGTTIKVQISKPPPRQETHTKKSVAKKKKPKTKPDADAGKTAKKPPNPDKKAEKQTKRPVVMFMPRSLK